jgi:hypothetical protein
MLLFKNNRKLSKKIQMINVLDYNLMLFFKNQDKI